MFSSTVDGTVIAKLSLVCISVAGCEVSGALGSGSDALIDDASSVAAAAGRGMARGGSGDGSGAGSAGRAGSASPGGSSGSNGGTTSGQGGTGGTESTGGQNNDSGDGGGDVGDDDQPPMQPEGGTSSGGAAPEIGGSVGAGNVTEPSVLATDPCVANDSCEPGTWVNVIPSDPGFMPFGPGSVIGNPLRPSDLYIGGGQAGVWKSTDYGKSWAIINSNIPYIAMGDVMAVAPTDPPSIYVAGHRSVYKSTDDGKTFVQIQIPQLDEDLYSIKVDPYDNNHLISGVHHAAYLMESFDAGVTWARVTGNGFPGGGDSWFVFFLDTGVAETTRGNWFAIAQFASATVTRDGGKTWIIPEGVSGLEHPHGNAQILQIGETLYVGGLYGPGSGLFKSTDLGDTFTRLWSGNLSGVWRSEKNLYAAFGSACQPVNCGNSTEFFIAPLDDEANFAKVQGPPGMGVGPSRVEVVSDGEQTIFVGSMWMSGTWRYIVPE